MAQITTYATLQTEIKRWLNDTSLDDTTVEGWIQLAEASFRRVLATLDNEATVSQVPADTNDTFPTGFNGLREAYISNSPKNPLELISPAQMTTFGDLTGTPRFITIESGQFRFLPSAQGYTVFYTYYRKLDALSDSNTDNYLLLEAPDVYLAQTMLIAQKDLRDDVDVSAWASIVNGWKEELFAQDKRRKIAGQVKRVGLNPSVGALG